MNDLFSTSSVEAVFDANMPLAARMRPTSLDDFHGQAHLLGPGKPLRNAIEKGQWHSMILWGPPGTGKTTLASIIAQHSDSRWVPLSAVMSGIKEIRAVIEQAKISQQQNQKTLLFVDEVHRFNKNQQDAFLPHVESGLLTFIGATTENPSFEVNNALLSRARVYQLKALSSADLRGIVDRAVDVWSQQHNDIALQFDASLSDQLVACAAGDARRALGLLETVLDGAVDGQVTAELLKEVLIDAPQLFDKQGDVFYDQISALHKSVRGSSPDAALYWFSRMIDGGCDPLYVARRVVRMATEDIGNADPRALSLALNAWDVQQRLGSPEGELAIAQAIVYLAVAPKSNAVYLAYQKAMIAAKRSPSLSVPLHLRNAPTQLMKDLGCGHQYRYAHDEPGGYAAGESYLPEGIPATQYYEPKNTGLESKIKEKLNRLQQLDKEHQS